MCLRLPLESTNTIRHPGSPSLRTVPTYVPVGMALILIWFLLDGSVSRQACLNYDSHFALSVQWLNRCREPASGSPTASLVRSMEFHQGRGGPLESLALDGALTAGNIGPP